jgi:hypothetical protein
MANAILGPVLSDILELSHGKSFVLASAFYSEARLDASTMSANSIELLLRLDLRSIDDWVARSIAPDALLRFWKRHQKYDVNVYCGPQAHAKIYAGDDAFLVGSANFTVRGLGGLNDEILWRETSHSAIYTMARALREYRSSLQQIQMYDLEAYVDKNLERVTQLQGKVKSSSENTLPSNPKRPARIGTYETFLQWLKHDESAAAREILDRANGKGQLSGHIKMNFYGLRQFLLGNPICSEDLTAANPDTYRLCKDASMERAIKRFVTEEAIDEGGLCVPTWKTYLPMRSGGAPKSGGATSGNLNRMLPLLARFQSRP